MVKGEYDFGDLSVIGHMKDTGRVQTLLLLSLIRLLCEN